MVSWPAAGTPCICEASQTALFLRRSDHAALSIPTTREPWQDISSPEICDAKKHPTEYPPDMRTPILTRPWLGRFCAWMMGLTMAVAVLRADDVTHLNQIRSLASQKPTASHHFHLEGDIWWINPASEKIVLKDDSGAEELEMDLRGQPVESGQRIVLDGDGTITPTSGGFKT